MCTIYLRYCMLPLNFLRELLQCSLNSFMHFINVSVFIRLSDGARFIGFWQKPCNSRFSLLLALIVESIIGMFFFKDFATA